MQTEVPTYLMSVKERVSGMVTVWAMLGAVAVPLYSSTNTFSSMEQCEQQQYVLICKPLLSIMNSLYTDVTLAPAPLNVQYWFTSVLSSAFPPLSSSSPEHVAVDIDQFLTS